MDHYQKFFDHMYDTHNVILTGSEMEDIIHEVKKMIDPFEIIQDFMNGNREWTDQTFRGSCAISALRHLQQEVSETIASISCNDERDKTSIEFADMYLLLLNAAHHVGISFKELHGKGIEKMNINRQRRWEKNLFGFYHHVKENSQNDEPDDHRVW